VRIRGKRVLLSETFQEEGHPPGSPAPRLRLEQTGARRMTETASPVLRHIPLIQFVPVPTDEFLMTVVAIRAAALFILHIAGIGVPDAVDVRLDANRRTRQAEEPAADSKVT